MYTTPTLRRDQKGGVEGSKSDLILMKDVRAAVRDEVVRFISSPVLPFNKYKYFALVAKSYASVLVLGRWTAHYWKWHLAQYLFLIPLQIYRWTLMKKIAIMIEFCWIANAFIMIYLGASLLFPNWCDIRVRAVLFRMLFAFGTGPLGLATIATGNALVPHSVDHVAILLIHLQPMLSAFTLKYCVTDLEVFPVNEPVSFLDYVAPPLAFIGVHAVFHSVFFLWIGLQLPEQGYETAPDNLLNPEGENMYTRVFGKVGSGGSENLRFLKFEAAFYAAIALVTAATYLLYIYGNSWIAEVIVVTWFAASAWFGAQWYERRIGSIMGAIDELMCDK